MSLRLNVLDAAANALTRLVWDSPKWLSAMWLPWLLGSAIYTYAAYAVPRAFQIGALPGLLAAFIFLPFSAIVASAVLNNIIHRKPCGFRSLKLSQDTARVAVVILAVSLVSLLSEFVKDQVVISYANQRISSGFVFSLEETQRIVAATSGLVWLFICVANALIYPMMPIVVERRSFDFKRWSTLIRLHGLRFFLLVVLLSAAYKGFEKAYVTALSWIISLPYPDGTGLMREFLIRQFLQLLVYLPIDFILEVLPSVAAGTVYVALRSKNDSDG